MADRSARSVYAVTAFSNAPADPELWGMSSDGARFAAIADRYERSCGTAFAIDDAGHLLTSEHVIGNAASVWVTDDTGHVLPAVVIGSDPRGDLAVLQIPAATLGVRLSDTAAARGDLVVTLGNPDGMAADGSLCASVGNVSVADRSLPRLSERERRSYAHMIQVTTPISVGSSGGPLLDLKGEAIGIVCAVGSGESAALPIGFATSLATAGTRDRIARLAHGNEVIYAYLGVMVSRDETGGARVDHVEDDAPAQGVLHEGDVVIRFAGEPVDGDRRFIELAGACRVDAEVSMVVRRGPAEIELNVRPCRRTLPGTAISRATQRLVWRGVTFANADGGGVRIIATSGDAPLACGTLVNRVNGTPVADVGALLVELHRHAGEAIHLDDLD